MIFNVSYLVCNGPFHWLSPKRWFPYYTQNILLNAVSWLSIAVKSCPIDWSIRELTLRYNRAFRIGIIRPKWKYGNKSTRTYFWSTRTLVNSYLSQLVPKYFFYLFRVSLIGPQFYLARKFDDPELTLN